MRIAGFNIWPVESLRFRLLAAFSLLTLLISVTFVLVHISREIRSHSLRTNEKAQILASELSTAIRLPLFAEDIPTLQRHAEETARARGVFRVTIRNAAGRVLAEAGNRDRGTQEDKTASEVEVRPSTLEESGEERFSGSHQAGPPLGKVRVSMDDSELRSFVLSLLSTSIVTMLLLWLTVSCAAIFVVQRITGSLQPLSDGIDALKGGDFSTRIPAVGKDEIAVVASVINDLAEGLQQRERENSRLQQELLDAMKNEVREERRRMMAKLIQANRMTSLGLLVSSTAHEINTPNGSIRLAGQQIGKVWKDAVPILDRVANEEGEFAVGGISYREARDQVLRSLDVIVRSSERIDRVVRDLREHGTGHGGANDSLSLNQVVGDALAMIRSRGALDGISIESRLDEGIPSIKGKKYQLEQVVTNLVLNAVQAIPPGEKGVVEVATGFEEACGDVIVSVRDNGEGIPDEIRTSLTEPFFSTRMEKGGSGLGLYISDYLIKEHNGSLSIDSTLGQGSTFTVRIPAAR